MKTSDQRLARALVAALAVGFVYSEAATLRLSKEWWMNALPAKPDATIDQTLAITGIAHAADLRRAVAEAGWGPHEDVLVLGATSHVSPNDLTQIRFSASYLLYPRSVWADAWCDERGDSCSGSDASSDAMFAPKYRGTRHIMLVGPSNPFSGARAVMQVSPLVRLVDLQ